MKINQPAVAGTLESGDVMIRIAPLDTQDIDLQINSSVEKQFGDAIRTTILDVLARYNVRGVQLNVDDKGALDCILRARLEALLARASGIPALPWAISTWRLEGEAKGSPCTWSILKTNPLNS